MFGALLAWEAFKDWLSATVHLTHYDLHVVVGLLLFLVFGRWWRRPLASPIPLIPVAALEFLNELCDFARYYLSKWPWTPRETLIDIALTIGPSILVILVANLFGRRADVVPPNDEPDPA